MLAFCEARGLGLNAQPVVFGRKYYDDKARPYAMGDDQVRVMHRRLAEWKRQGRPLMFGASTYENVLSWADYGQLSRRTPTASTCMAGRFYIHIEQNGDIHPCGQHNASITPKNIVRDGLEDALGHVHSTTAAIAQRLLERAQGLFALRPNALLRCAARLIDAAGADIDAPVVERRPAPCRGRLARTPQLVAACIYPTQRCTCAASIAPRRCAAPPSSPPSTANDSRRARRARLRASPRRSAASPRARRRG